MNNNNESQTKKREFTIRWNFEEADRASGWLLSHTRLSAYKTRERDGGVQPLIIGEVVAAECLKALLPHIPEEGAKVGVIFLPSQLASFGEIIANQTIGWNSCWTLDLDCYTIFDTWKLPGLRLAAEHFDETLSSELWMPNSCLFPTRPYVSDDEDDKRMYIIFATPVEVFITSYLVNAQDVINQMCTGSYIKSTRRKLNDIYTPYQIMVHKNLAESFGRYPWMDGVWQIQPGSGESNTDFYGKPRKFINVIGGFIHEKVAT